MKKTIITVTFILSIAMFAIASADGASVYSKCKGCHGTDGSKVPLGVDSAVIKGQSAADIESKLKGYADGSYGGVKKTIMAGQAKRLSDEELKAVSEYISKF